MIEERAFENNLSAGVPPVLDAMDHRVRDRPTQLVGAGHGVENVGHNRPGAGGGWMMEIRDQEASAFPSFSIRR